MHSGKFNWTYVLGTGLMDPLYLGKTVIVHEGKNDAQKWLDLIQKHEATIFIGVPTIYRQILQKTSTTGAELPSHNVRAAKAAPVATTSATSISSSFFLSMARLAP